MAFLGESEKKDRIVKYINTHPGCTRAGIQKRTGASRSYIDQIISESFPEMRPPPKVPGAPSASQQRALDLKAEHPELTQAEIGRRLGIARSTVSLAICGAYGKLPRETPEHYNKPEPPSYKLLPCPVCGKDHKSTWAGDRFHTLCRKRNGEAEYMADYEFTTGRKTRSGPA